VGADVLVRCCLFARISSVPSRLSYAIPLSGSFSVQICRFILFLLALSSAAYVWAAQVVVEVIDDSSNARLEGVAVSVKEVLPDGSEAAVVSRTTDANGTIALDLDGLGAGRRYVFKAQPYGMWVSSEIASTPGWFPFRVGKLQVHVLDGSNDEPYRSREVTLLEKMADGTLQWRSTHRTDTEGFLRLDPPKLGSSTYVLRAASTVDGRLKDSSGYSQPGSYRFRVGGTAVTIGLIDHVSNVYLPGVDVSIYELLANGNEVPVLTKATDAAGHVKVDLDGLESGRRYVLKARPFGAWVTSDAITQPGGFGFRVGKLQVQVLNGNSWSPYALRDVTLLERQSDGSLRWSGTFRTDASGQLRLDPPKLGTNAYVLRAPSPVDGALKDSPLYTKGGSYQFAVGGKALTLGVIDDSSNARLEGVAVSVKEVLPDGSEAAVVSRTTDANGTIALDLDGLGAGRRYVFKAQPYGMWVSSEIASTPGWFPFRVGTSPVTLTRANGNAPLANVRIAAYQRLPDGTMVWVNQANTNNAGLARFDLEGLGSGRQYMLLASNPFGDGKNYFSTVMTAPGAFSFVIRADDPNVLDQSPPTLSIAEPGSNARISVGGLTLRGNAWDDQGVSEVRANIKLPSGLVIEKKAIYNAARNTWSIQTGGFSEEAQGAIKIVVTATDTSYNEAISTLDLILVNDVTTPDIVEISHKNGSAVPTGGFVLSGQITDDTIGTSMQATVSDGGSAAPITRNIEVAQMTGRWAMVLAPETLFDSALTVILSARDGAGNSTERVLTLNPSDDYAQAWHALQRTSFGATPDAYLSAARNGVNSALQQQMDPTAINNDSYEQYVAELPAGSNIATPVLRQAIYSSRQLLEVMTWFWDNHFNTYYYAHSNSEFEHIENESFRAHALGNFRSLLDVSAKSAAMLHTLDGRLNVKTDPNENYARELMELHSMGVAGGYSQRDVEEVARAFTGWSITSGVFKFEAAKHDTAAKSVLGYSIPAGGGQSDGERVLDIVAAHPSTAKFICSKLITLFVSDEPVDSLTTRCSQSFIAHQAAADQMAQVVGMIIMSPEFLDPRNRQSKLKTPLEFVLGAVRQLAGENAGDDLGIEIQRQGMGLFLNPSPTGYGETGRTWLSTSMLQTRSRFVDRLLSYTPATTQTRFSLVETMTTEGFSTAEGVVGRMLERLYGPTFASRQYHLALDLLTENGTYGYFPDAPDSELRLRRLGKALMSFPDYHVQ
jgi:large repetitive protein